MSFGTRSAAYPSSCFFNPTQSPPMMYFAPLTPEGATAFAAKLSVRAYGTREVVMVPAVAFRRSPRATRVPGQPCSSVRSPYSFTELVEQLSLQTVQNRVARYLYFFAREEGTASGSATGTRPAGAGRKSIAVACRDRM